MQKSQVWSHLNKNNQQFYSDSSICQTRANTVQIPQVDTSPVQSYGVGYGAGVAAFAEGFNRTAAYRNAMAQQEQIYSSCMRGAGWYLVDQNNQSPKKEMESAPQQANNTEFADEKEADKQPARFCWNDIHSDKNIDIYLDNCSYVVDKNNRHVLSWVRKVMSKSYKSEIFGEYDEVVKQIDFDCNNMKGKDIQSYYYSPEPANRLIYKERSKETIYSPWAITFDKEINNKAFETVCKL